MEGELRHITKLKIARKFLKKIPKSPELPNWPLKDHSEPAHLRVEFLILSESKELKLMPIFVVDDRFRKAKALLQLIPDTART